MGLAEHTFIQIILCPRNNILMRPREWRLTEQLDGFLELILLNIINKVNREQRRLHRLVLRPQSRVRLLYHARYYLAVVAFEQLLPYVLPQLQLLKKAR